MRHRVSGRKLNMPSDQRKALLRNLVSAALWNDEIDTTEARAKEASRMIDKVITLAKRNDLHARRQVSRLIYEQSDAFTGAGNRPTSDPRTGHKLLRRIFEEVAPLYRDIRGGYTRIIRLGPRRGDAAMMVRLELTKGISMAQRPASRRSQVAEAPVTRATAPVAAAATAPALPEASPAVTPAPAETGPVETTETTSQE